MTVAIQTTLILKENDLQKYCDKYLTEKGIKFFHIPDSFWGWVYKNCSVGVRCWLFKMFGGLPDALITIPIDDRYCLAINCELKRHKSYLRASQRKEAGRLPWVTCRTPEDIERTIKNAQDMAKRIQFMIGGFK